MATNAANSTEAIVASDVFSRLQEAICNKTAHVAVIGLGYVGLPLVVHFAEAGFRCHSRVKRLSAF